MLYIYVQILDFRIPRLPKTAEYHAKKPSSAPTEAFTTTATEAPITVAPTEAPTTTVAATESHTTTVASTEAPTTVAPTEASTTTVAETECPCVSLV